MLSQSWLRQWIPKLICFLRHLSKLILMLELTTNGMFGWGRMEGKGREGTVSLKPLPCSGVFKKRGEEWRIFNQTSNILQSTPSFIILSSPIGEILKKKVLPNKGYGNLHLTIPSSRFSSLPNLFGSLSFPCPPNNSQPFP